MSTQVAKVIRRLGKPVDVLQSTGGGGREFPGESVAGTVDMVIEQRGAPITVTDSSGTDHEVDIEFRAVVADDDPEILDPGADEGPSILDHPDAGRYRVVKTFPEDVDVLVINAVED